MVKTHRCGAERLLHVVAAAMLLSWPAGAQELAFSAEKPDSDAPVVLEAREMGYDQKHGVVVALGDVEVVQGDYVLRAEQLTYYQKLGLVRAKGNVSLLQPTGDIMFAEEVELKDDLKAGLIQEFRARLSDNSRFAAKEAVRESPYRTKLSKAVYSPCKLCKGKAPFWQLRAGEVDIDEFNEKITYNDAWMEIAGVPVAYIPRMSHPTPDADAKSGFLAPEYSVNNQFGLTLKAPYYWRIAPNQQALITPWYTAEDGPLLQTEYEQLRDEGQHLVMFSAAYPERRSDTGSQIGGNEFRGHLFARGSHAFDDNLSIGYDINRTSDDTYLRRYNFSNEAVLFSRAFAQHVDGRNFLSAQGLAIQGLRVFDDPDTTPLILPTLEGYYETAPNDFGLKYFTSANAQLLSREVGVDQRRLSTSVGANIPYVSDGGHVLNATATMRTDFYQSDDVTIAGNPQLQSGSETRLIPQLALEWRYPLIRRMASSSLTIEPLVLGVVQPNGNNPALIANEDSRVVELTDTNIFSVDRFPGLDAVDSGSRVSYGLRAQYLTAKNRMIEFLFGQSYNADDDTPFPNSNVQGEHLSDYIGRIAYQGTYSTLAYRFGLDKDRFSPNRNELGGTYQFGKFLLSGNYLTLKDNVFLGDSEQVFGSIGFPIYGGFSANFGATRDILSDQMLFQNATLTYENDCFNVSLLGLRTFVRDRDVEPVSQISLRVGFKNLGEFGDVQQ